MKIYSVYKRFAIEVRRDVSAETIAEAEEKANKLKVDRYFRAAPGAELLDWESLLGTSIHEERE